MPRKPYNDKPYANSWDAPLTDLQRWQAYDKFVQFRAKWWEVAKWVEEELHVAAPSRSGLYRFADRMRRLESGHRVEQSILARAEIGELASKAGQRDAEMVAAYETLAADAALQFGDAKKASLFTKMAIAIGDKQATKIKLELKAREVASTEKAVNERIKSDREKAVDALIEEAKGNAPAMALLNRFLEALNAQVPT